MIGLVVGLTVIAAIAFRYLRSSTGRCNIRQVDARNKSPDGESVTFKSNYDEMPNGPRSSATLQNSAILSEDASVTTDSVVISS